MLDAVRRFMGRLGRAGASDGDLAHAQSSIAMNGGREQCLALAKDQSLSTKAIVLLAKRKLPDVMLLLAEHSALTAEIADTMVRRGYATGEARAKLVARFGLDGAMPSSSIAAELRVSPSTEGVQDELHSKDLQMTAGLDEADLVVESGASGGPAEPAGIVTEEGVLLSQPGAPEPRLDVDDLIGDEELGGDIDATPVAMSGGQIDDVWVPHASGITDGSESKSESASVEDQIVSTTSDLGDAADLDEDLFCLAEDLVMADALSGEIDALSETAPSRDERAERILAEIFGTDVDGSAFAGLRARLEAGSPVGKLLVSIHRLIDLGYDHDTILLAFDLRNEWVDRYGYQVRETHLSWDTAVQLVEATRGASDVCEVWALLDAIIHRYTRHGGGVSRTLGHYVARVVDDYHSSLMRGGHAPAETIFG